MSTLVREWGIPEVSLRLVSDNSIQFVLEDNHQLYAKLENKTLPRRVDTSVEWLDLSVPGAEWVSWPHLNTNRCCWPQVRGRRVLSGESCMNDEQGWDAGE